MTAVHKVGPAKNPFRTITLVGASLLLHLVIIGGLSLSHSPNVSKKPTPLPIEARLVIPPPPAKTAPLAPAPDIVKEETPAEPSPAPPQETTQQRAENNKPQIHTTAPNSLAPEPVSAPANTLSVSPRAALNHYMEQQQQAEAERLASQAARQFRQHKNSPVIVDSRAKMDAEPYVRPVSKINCNSSLNKAVGIASALVGGTLKCTDRSEDLNLYIDNRTGKAAEN